MTQTTTYSEKLKNPLWQKRRLDILALRNWTCADCGSGLNDGKTLHVHHIDYVFGRDPWNYEDSNFEVLCEQCHANRHKPAPPIKKEADTVESEHPMGNPVMVAAFKILYTDLKPEINRLFTDVDDVSKQVVFLFNYENVQVEQYLIFSTINNPDTAKQYQQESTMKERFGRVLPDYETYAFKQYFELRAYLIRTVVESIMFENMELLRDNKDREVEMKCMIFHSKIVTLKNRFVQFCKKERA